MQDTKVTRSIVITKEDAKAITHAKKATGIGEAELIRLSIRRGLRQVVDALSETTSASTGK